MNTFHESWSNFVPTKKERRIRAVKDALTFTGLVVLHMAFIACVWISVIIVLSL